MSHDRSPARSGARAQVTDRGEILPGITPAKGLFLVAAGISFLASVSLFFSGDHERGIFVGIWVPSILSAGALLLGRSEHD